MDSLWNRKVVSLLSSVMTVVCLPISCTSSVDCWPHDPAVSMATGKKICVFSSPWYFAVLLSAACLPAAPCSAAVELRWDLEKVSGMAMSQDIHFSVAGIFGVATPGRSASLLRRPAGSSTTGICGLLTALRMMSFISLWRCCLGELLLQVKPCKPRVSTVLPQTQTCDYMPGIPQDSAIAIMVVGR